MNQIKPIPLETQQDNILLKTFSMLAYSVSLILNFSIYLTWSEFQRKKFEQDKTVALNKWYYFSSFFFLLLKIKPFKRYLCVSIRFYQCKNYQTTSFIIRAISANIFNHNNKVIHEQIWIETTLPSSSSNDVITIDVINWLFVVLEIYLKRSRKNIIFHICQTN